MREIKFRAWDTERKIMAQVNYLGLNDYEVGMKAKCENWNAPYPYVCKLMQYTGLKDENGKEIYEGDIVKLKPHHKEKERDLLNFLIEDVHYKIEYINASFALINTITLEIDSYLGDYGENALEVTGNVYENKDLLK